MAKSPNKTPGKSVKPSASKTPPAHKRGSGVGEAPMAEFKAQKAAAVAIAEAQDLWTPHRPERNWDKFEGGKKFRVASNYEPAGDQPTWA